MPEVTQILQSISNGDEEAADILLPIVYEDLRRLARIRLANEASDHTLQATALVHEAYVRLVGDSEMDWNGAGHFFAAAAEAMRRILIDRARRRCARKRGGDRERIQFCENLLADQRDERLVQLDETLDQLQEYDPRKADVVKLRFFAGLPNHEVATALNISPATAQREWQFAKAWLRSRMSG